MHKDFLNFISTNTGLKSFLIIEIISDIQVKEGTIISPFFFYLKEFLELIMLLNCDDPELTKHYIFS